MSELDVTGRNVVHHFISWLRRVMFPELVVRGLDKMPTSGSLIVVSHHPNGMIDGGILLDVMPRLASILAKQPLFTTPIAGHMLRALNAQPVYRKQDAVSGNNTAMFEAVNRHLRQGGAISIYPEGISHDEPGIMKLKTGAARMALSGNVESILPVSLLYTDKGEFRSSVMLSFGAPFSPTDSDDVASLTQRIKESLRKLTIEYPNRKEFRRIERAVHVSLDSPLDQRADGLRRLIERMESMSSQERNDLIASCDRIALLGFRMTSRVSIKTLVPTLVFGPVSLLGYISSWPLERLITFLARRHSPKPDIMPSSKLLGCILFYPLTWLVVVSIAGFTQGFGAAVAGGIAWPITLAGRVLSVRPIRELWHTILRRRALRNHKVRSDIARIVHYCEAE